MIFYKQKTAYDVRISDWSSDVCSSDLHGQYVLHPVVQLGDQHLLTCFGLRQQGNIDKGRDNPLDALVRSAVRHESNQEVRSFLLVDTMFHQLSGRQDGDRKSTRLNSSH